MDQHSTINKVQGLIFPTNFECIQALHCNHYWVSKSHYSDHKTLEMFVYKIQILCVNRFSATFHDVHVPSLQHDDVIKWNHFLRYWPVVRGIHRHTQRPVTGSFDVFFDLCLNKRLRKQSWGWWFETLSRPLWRHGNVLHMDVLRQYTSIYIHIHCLGICCYIHKQYLQNLKLHNIQETITKCKFKRKDLGPFSVTVLGRFQQLSKILHV